MQETWVLSLSWADLLEKEMATHSSVLAWRITWTEESGGLQSMGWQRVRHDWATNTLLLYLHTFCAHGKITGSKYKRMVVWEFLPVGLRVVNFPRLWPCAAVMLRSGHRGEPVPLRWLFGGPEEVLANNLNAERRMSRVRPGQSQFLESHPPTPHQPDIKPVLSPPL